MRHIFRKYYRLFSVSKYVLLLNISDKLYSFIIMLLLAREFSSEIFGEIVTLLTFAMVMQMIFDLGLPALIQREVAAGSANYSSIFSVSFTFVLFLLPVYIGAGYLLKTILYPLADPVIFLIIFLFMYEALLVNVCNKALSGKEDYKSQFVSFFISRVYILIFFLWGLYFARLSLVSLMLVILSGFFLNLVLIFWALDKNGINFRFKEFSFLKIKHIVTAAIPLGLAVIFNFMYDKIDVILISKLQDFNQVAYYNIGYGVYKGAAIGFSFLLVTGYTTISAINKDKEAVKKFFNELAKVLIAICVISGILLFIFADLIIGFLYTERYQPAAIVIKILSVGFIGLGLNNLTGIALNGMGYFKVVMYITLYGLIINVILNVFFIPVYGIKAASVISAITEYFIFFMQFYYLRKILASPFPLQKREV